jgi:hypothetical protein
MKSHLKGSSLRTICGNKITEKTVILENKYPGAPMYAVECNKCLWRLIDDKKYVEEVFLAIRERWLSLQSSTINLRGDE